MEHGTIAPPPWQGEWKDRLRSLGWALRTCTSLQIVEFLYGESSLADQFSKKARPSSSCCGMDRVYSYPGFTIIT